MGSSAALQSLSMAPAMAAFCALQPIPNRFLPTRAEILNRLLGLLGAYSSESQKNFHASVAWLLCFAFHLKRLVAHLSKKLNSPWEILNINFLSMLPCRVQIKSRLNWLQPCH
ncbi:hypothetical protein CLI92_12225 [Vandammella animalimorsus]|uniref:Secreted protein n=1 Tax=Vandammella animalimorsus TaxID=2029117 RepID=A0A2A2T2U4_9BURK|nr:hypothetical protein CK626_10905 [Vandammella animalimorsus]PAX15760.1 hypothetical protein CLI92_12225 [Vandammella animalimorsus]PAX19644.1 hypothetical protein CLI93_05720 [Vandammella animalimorsus]